ncbi:MAG: hypothetical protein M3O46_13750 [Myxococcota bacterium]|nr:hypothetical protein [Myxococcota bacterium]
MDPLGSVRAGRTRLTIRLRPSSREDFVRSLPSLAHDSVGSLLEVSYFLSKSSIGLLAFDPQAFVGECALGIG